MFAKPGSPRPKNLRRSAGWLLFVLAGSVFLIETLLMLLLPELPALSEKTKTFLDASSLSILLFPLFYFLVFRPLTRSLEERERMEEKLRLAASVFTDAREGIMITGVDGGIVAVNETFTRITGYEADEVLGRNPRLLNSGRQPKEFYAAMWQSLIEKGHWYGEVWNRRKNGEFYAAMLTISAVRDAMHETQHYVALFSDITPIKEHQQQLEHIAHYDALTNLPNRVLLGDRLRQAIIQSQRRNLPLAVAYLDLDGFKEVNDIYGHNIGDELLIVVTQRLKAVLRDGDTLARLGGDEFVAVLVDLNLNQDYETIIYRLLQAAAAPVDVNGMTLNITASIGVTHYPQDGVDADQLIRHADQAMYQAKQAGKNRFHLFDLEQDAAIQTQRESLEEIRCALDRREFELYYQPQVNMMTGEIVGLEALIRWRHPERGILLPAAFLPIVESHPISVNLGEWVIETALWQMSRWQDMGLNIPVSVNVSARQLQDDSFVPSLRRLLLANADVSPDHLELEVLETNALGDMAEVSEIMRSCSDLGVRFALDDFGTGYSSLMYLRRLPVGKLKIDQAFVRDVLEDTGDLAIVDGVMGLADAFHRQVLAEGVETQQHGELLLALGCELAQGYAISRPIPTEDVPQWVENWRPDSCWVAWRNRNVSRDNRSLIFAEVMHRHWLWAIESYLAGVIELPPPLDTHDCRLGQWLDGEGKSRYGRYPAFKKIVDLHDRVHRHSEHLIQASVVEDADNRLSGLDDLHVLRDELVSGLHDLMETPGSLVRLVWHERYQCGHPTIDWQHKRLIDKSNELLSAVITGGQRDEITDLMNRLLADVEAHFSDEEKVLHDVGFPKIAEHKAIHRGLLDKARHLASQYAKDALATGELFSFLVYDVIVIHMLADDREFVSYLHPVDATAAPA